MKTQTFGLSNRIQVYSTVTHGQQLKPLEESYYFQNGPQKDAFILGCAYEGSIHDYWMNRANGSAKDSPSWEFPKDGKYSYDTPKENCFVSIRYTEGPKDRAWMEERDKNYSARLEREKQPAEMLAKLRQQYQELGEQQQQLIHRAQTQAPWLLNTKLQQNREANRLLYQVQIPVTYTYAPVFPSVPISPSIVIPADFRCSITKLIMLDPVTNSVNQTYEREAISGWLETHDTDPQTNAQLTDKKLNPNVFAKRIITGFLDQNPVLRGSDEVFLPQQVLLNLRQAIEQHDLNTVSEIIRQDKRVLARYLAPGRTAFHAASEIGTPEMVEHILSNLNEGERAAMFALVKPESWWPLGLNEPLLKAAAQGDIVEMTRMLDLGAELEAHDGDWKTPLCKAAAAGKVEAVNFLLERGADISARDQENNAPLDLAMLQGHSHIVTRLLDQGLPTYTSTFAGDPKCFSYMALKRVHEQTKRVVDESSMRQLSSESQEASTSATAVTSHVGFFESVRPAMSPPPEGLILKPK